VVVQMASENICFGVRIAVMGQMGSDKCVVVQKGSEICCGGSYGE
jgi:type II secretory pathway predicted ATPase ExeA